MRLVPGYPGDGFEVARAGIEVHKHHIRQRHGLRAQLLIGQPIARHQHHLVRRALRD